MAGDDKTIEGIRDLKRATGVIVNSGEGDWLLAPDPNGGEAQIRVLGLLQEMYPAAGVGLRSWNGMQYVACPISPEQLKQDIFIRALDASLNASLALPEEKREVLCHLNVRCLERMGFDADEVILTLNGTVPKIAATLHPGSIDEGMVIRCNPVLETFISSGSSVVKPGSSEPKTFVSRANAANNSEDILDFLQRKFFTHVKLGEGIICDMSIERLGAFTPDDLIFALERKGIIASEYTSDIHGQVVRTKGKDAEHLLQLYIDKGQSASSHSVDDSRFANMARRGQPAKKARLAAITLLDFLQGKFFTHVKLGEGIICDMPIGRLGVFTPGDLIDALKGKGIIASEYTSALNGQVVRTKGEDAERLLQLYIDKGQSASSPQSPASQYPNNKGDKGRG